MARERRKDRENVKEWILGKLCAAAGLRDQLGQLICRAKAHRATDRHHTRGRVGTLLHDRRFWLPLCRCSHNWVNDHPLTAKALGLLDPGPWNHAPKKAA